MEDSFNLGAYMKNYRQERHISLRAAFPEAASTLSRFENGKTRMGGRKLRVVMQREGLRYWDFQQNSLEYLSPFKQLIDNLYIKRFNLRVETVTADIQLFRTRTAGSNSRLVNVVNAVLDMLFCDGDVGNSRLAKETQLSIQELLFRARDWIIFDYGLLWLSAPYLDTIMLKRLFRRAMIQYRDAPSGYVDYFVRVLDRISVILLCRHDEDVAALAAPFVNVNKIDASIGDDAVSFRFLQIMFANGTRTEKERQIGHLQEKLQVIGLSAMQAYFRRLADLILEVPTVGGNNDTDS
jgi:transcriptional regulator with XRE-family HTH domain